MKLVTYLVLLALTAIQISAHANPVSFNDGWGIMPTYAGDWSDLQVNYSLSHRDAIGVSTFVRDGSNHNATFGLLQYNYLLKRWNELESQANVYLLAGGGGRNDSDDGNSVAGYGGIEGDYETRHLYTLISAETLQSPGGGDFSRFRYRAGLSPYKAPIDKLNTWLITQIDYMPKMKAVRQLEQT